MSASSSASRPRSSHAGSGTQSPSQNARRRPRSAATAPVPSRVRIRSAPVSTTLTWPSSVARATGGSSDPSSETITSKAPRGERLTSQRLDQPLELPAAVPHRHDHADRALMLMFPRTSASDPPPRLRHNRHGMPGGKPTESRRLRGISRHARQRRARAGRLCGSVVWTVSSRGAVDYASASCTRSGSRSRIPARHRDVRWRTCGSVRRRLHRLPERVSSRAVGRLRPRRLRHLSEPELLYQSGKRLPGIVFQPARPRCVKVSRIDLGANTGSAPRNSPPCCLTLSGFVTGRIYSWETGGPRLHDVAIIGNDITRGTAVGGQSLVLSAPVNVVVDHNRIGPTCCGQGGNSPTGIVVSSSDAGPRAQNVTITNNLIQVITRDCGDWPTSGWGPCPSTTCGDCHSDCVHVQGRGQPRVCGQQALQLPHTGAVHRGGERPDEQRDDRQQLPRRHAGHVLHVRRSDVSRRDRGEVADRVQHVQPLDRLHEDGLRAGNNDPDRRQRRPAREQGPIRRQLELHERHAGRVLVRLQRVGTGRRPGRPVLVDRHGARHGSRRRGNRRANPGLPPGELHPANG